MWPVAAIAAKATPHDPGLVRALEKLVDPATRGGPPLAAPLDVLARELTRTGHPVSHHTVRTLLQGADHSLQANCKTREGKQHPDRNAQFEHIAGA